MAIKGSVNVIIPINRFSTLKNAPPSTPAYPLQLRTPARSIVKKVTTSIARFTDTLLYFAAGFFATVTMCSPLSYMIIGMKP